MRFNRVSLEDCSEAAGTVVVIDVLRAFSTASYAFALGAPRIFLVSRVEEALDLKRRFPFALLVGEVKGLSVEGFNFGNSPTELIRQNLAGIELIQRTSAGTQGVVRSINASTLLASSFCCAGATARLIRQHPDAPVTFVITGRTTMGWGDEDEACADYIESLLKGENPDPEAYLERVRRSVHAQDFLDPNQPELPPSDLDYCTAVDRFDFAMEVERRDGLFVLKPVRVND